MLMLILKKVSVIPVTEVVIEIKWSNKKDESSAYSEI